MNKDILRARFVEDNKGIEVIEDMGIYAYMCCDDQSASYNDEYVEWLEEHLLRLFGVSSSFSVESRHICMVNIDKQGTCIVCGKQNCV